VVTPPPHPAKRKINDAQAVVRNAVPDLKRNPQQSKVTPVRATKMDFQEN
jgi:hypothetical protein